MSGNQHKVLKQQQQGKRYPAHVYHPRVSLPCLNLPSPSPASLSYLSLLPHSSISLSQAAIFSLTPQTVVISLPAPTSLLICAPASLPDLTTPYPLPAFTHPAPVSLTSLTPFPPPPAHSPHGPLFPVTGLILSLCPLPDHIFFPFALLSPPTPLNPSSLTPRPTVSSRRPAGS